MGGLVRRAAVAAGAAVVVLGTATGTASATQKATLAFTPSPYDYGQVTPGNTDTQTFTLANTGGKASGRLTITTPGSAAFTITADTCPGRLGPRKTCTVTVQFAPASAGIETATLTAANNSTVLATDPLTGTGAAPGHLYWDDDTSGAIMKANLDGTGVTTLIASEGAVAVDSSHIYWGNVLDPGGAIMKANLDGTGVTTLVADAGADVVAVGNGHIYWANAGTPVTVMEANLDGTGVTTVISGLVGPGLDGVNGIAVDSSHIYLTIATSTGAGEIMEANLDGTGVATIVTAPQPVFEIAVDSSHIYWAQKGPVINEANLDGSDVTALVSGQQVGQSFPIGVAVDSSHIYWTTILDGTIKEANLDGTGVTTLVTGQGEMDILAVGP